MTKLRRKIQKELELKRLAKSTAAVSGLAGAASAATGVVAALAAPTGLTALSVALGISSVPLIVTAAPIVAGVAVAAGTAAGVLRFCHWYKERSEENDSPAGKKDFEEEQTHEHKRDSLSATRPETEVLSVRKTA